MLFWSKRCGNSNLEKCHLLLVALGRGRTGLFLTKIDLEHYPGLDTEGNKERASRLEYAVPGSASELLILIFSLCLIQQVCLAINPPALPQPWTTILYNLLLLARRYYYSRSFEDEEQYSCRACPGGRIRDQSFPIPEVPPVLATNSPLE